MNACSRKLKCKVLCTDSTFLNCYVCNFNFKEFYGEIGKDFIHVHHLKPLSEIGEKYKLDPIQDLRPVCPNCHAMLHRTKSVTTIEALQ